MKTSTKLFIAGAILWAIAFVMRGNGLFVLLGFICIVGGIIVVISHGLKEPKVTPKKNKNTTPPWEE